MMGSIIRSRRIHALAAAVTLALAGCAHRDDSAAAVAAGKRLAATARPVPMISGNRFRILLDFEAETDLAIIGSPSSGGVARETRFARSGRTSLRISPDAKDFVIRLGALLGGRP